VTDDGLDPVHVTGRWVGFYRHQWEQLGTYPIVAEIQQTGNKITGEMYDQITERSDYFDDFVKLLGNDISDDTRFKMQQMIHLFGPDTVRNSRLPETSDIQGRIMGGQVQFTKTYRGAIEVTWTVEDRTVAKVRRDGHQVQYEGHLDRDRMCIVGGWLIRPWGLFGRFLPPQARGRFELYKKS
jgi:hypothetical protein